MMGFDFPDDDYLDAFAEEQAAIGDAYAARRRRAMAGDVGALGPHLVREIVAEVGPRFDSLSEDSARSIFTASA